jgi:hypothetical protein
MRRALVALLLLAAAPAAAETELTSPQCQHACLCTDATSPVGCVDKAGCVDFCKDHDGVATHVHSARGHTKHTKKEKQAK